MRRFGGVLVASGSEPSRMTPVQRGFANHIANLSPTPKPQDPHPKP